MHKCLVLVVLGLGMCYSDHVNYPKPVSRPGQTDWNYPPSHSGNTDGPSHSEHWNFQTGFYWQNGFSWHDPGQSHQRPGQIGQNYNPSQTESNGKTDTVPSSYPTNGQNAEVAAYNPGQVQNTDPIFKPFDTSQIGPYDKSHYSHNPSQNHDVQNGNTKGPNEMPNRNTTAVAASNPDSKKAVPPTISKPSTPHPATMSRPVPALGQFQAPSLQWHVGIYSKLFTPFMQICGGSLVKADVVISAAHCFWSDDVGLLRPALFAVAAGKLLRPWDASADAYAQKSDISEIKVPPRFQGAKTNFQDDIAIASLTSPLEYALGVKPICVDFDLAFDRQHLQSRRPATVAGWGLTEPNGPPAQRLNFLKLPYVAIEDCIRTADPSFLKYITSDKICAGDRFTGRALCRGDSGGALTYCSQSVPYLRGIASTAPRDENDCNAYAVASFTYLRAHMTFLTDHVPNIAEGCRMLYNESSPGPDRGDSTACGES